MSVNLRKGADVLRMGQNWTRNSYGLLVNGRWQIERFTDRAELFDALGSVAYVGSYNTVEDAKRAAATYDADSPHHNVATGQRGAQW